MIENTPSYHLSGIVHDRNELVDFEGPLSLILLLLDKNKVEIRELKVTQILDQYLEYLKEMEEMNLEIASEFIQMASYLLLIKTKELLSGDEEVSELEMLMESLEQLRARGILGTLKKVQGELASRYASGVRLYSRPRMPLPQSGKEYLYHHDGVELLQALARAVLSGGEKPLDDGALQHMTDAIPRRIQYSVSVKSKEVLTALSRGPMPLNELYASARTASEAVATFVSVLELIAHGTVRVDRESPDTEWSIALAGGSATDEQLQEYMKEIDIEYQ